MSTLKKIKEGLKKKLQQLTTLCDVPACMIVHDTTTNSSSIWPEDSGQVRSLIDSYKAYPSGVKTYGLSDFFKGRQKNVEEELAKLRKKNAESKYRTWDYRLDLMDESQLRGLAAKVRSKAQAVRSRIDFLKQEAMVKKENDVVLDLDEFEHINQDDIFSAADVMAAMSANAQLPGSDYYCPPSMPFMDHNYLNYTYCGVSQNVNADQNLNFSSMDVNQNMNWRADQNLNFTSMDVNQNMNWCADQNLNFTSMDVNQNMNWCADQNLNFSPMDVNQNVNWCADQNLNFVNQNVNWCADQNLNFVNQNVNWCADQNLNFVNQNVNWCADQSLNFSSMDVNQNVNWCADQSLNFSSMDVNQNVNWCVDQNLNFSSMDVNQNVNWCVDQNLNFSSMNVNQNVNWCADQNLNFPSMNVNWYAGDDGGDYLWH
ncbi:MADS-box protein GGM13-like [Salvia divinorum]|uniref:MADS-box protein GGM13-like n=1 Tax=Salvia divinorum TaxID=28513 RepID=A0ABD1IDN1_SALDI